MSKNEILFDRKCPIIQNFTKHNANNDHSVYIKNTEKELKKFNARLTDFKPNQLP